MHKVRFTLQSVSYFFAYLSQMSNFFVVSSMSLPQGTAAIVVNYSVCKNVQT